MTIYSVIEKLASRQLGLVTARQLAELGIDRGQRRRAVESGRLVLVRRGVYRLCGAIPSWRLSALAAVLAAGSGAVLSHRSAAILWDMIDPHREAGPLEITAPTLRRLEGVRAHRVGLSSKEVTRRFGIPVTTAERTLLDLANSVDAGELGRLCDEALRRRILTVGKLRGVVDAHQGPGRRRLKPAIEVLSDRIPGYDPGANDWEFRMDELWDELGLPPAERQYRIRIGQRTYRPDRAIVDLKIAVEWTGFDPHGRRGNLDKDSDRRAALAAAGWYPLDFTSRSRPEVICRTVLAVVDERRRLTEGGGVSRQRTPRSQTGRSSPTARVSSPRPASAKPPSAPPAPGAPLRPRPDR
jgi:hypothetical protein